MLIERYELKRIPGGCEDDQSTVSVQATLPDDISDVLPYMNARAPGCSYNSAGAVLSWGEAGSKVVLRARELAISNRPSWEDARAAMERLVGLVNDTWQRRQELAARHEPYPQATPLAVYQRLPRTNCRECGEASCYTFALRLVAREAQVDLCSDLIEPSYSSQREELEAMLLPPLRFLFPE